MEGKQHDWWATTVRIAKVVGYLAMLGALLGNVVRATQMCLDVRNQRQQVGATLNNLRAQDQELDCKLKELRDASGRDLVMKKRLYLKKDERWLLFEKNGHPFSFEPAGGTLPGVAPIAEATLSPADSR